MDARLRRLVIGVWIIALAVLLAGCTTPTGEPNNTGTGALVGGVGGAGLGALLSHGHPAGALLGGAAGAITGAIIGNSADQAARPPVYMAGPPAPPPHYLWVNGQWVWNGGAWVWVPAHWALVP